MGSNGAPAMMVRVLGLGFRSTFIHATRAALLVAFIGAVAPGLASAQPMVIYDGPFTAIQENPCLAGELVEVTGRLVITDYTRVDGSGGLHHTFRVVTKAQGKVAASLFAPQKDYVLNDENISEFNAPANGVFETTLVINHLMIRKSEMDGTGDALLLGTGEDFMSKDTIHFTVVNGVPTASVSKGHARCM